MAIEANPQEGRQILQPSLEQLKIAEEDGITPLRKSS
jgi:hypothetical protein